MSTSNSISGRHKHRAPRGPRGSRPHQDTPDDPTRHNIALSKALSWLLRHNAIKEGLDLDSGGYVPVEDVLKHQNFTKYTVEDITQVVQDNDKQRFSLKTDESTGKVKIRANQGHSIKVEDKELLHQIKLDELQDHFVVVHGTYLSNWGSIKKSGLRRMSRNHIHFANGEPGTEGVLSGMRKSAQVYIYIDLPKGLKDGLPFFRSENGVILCPGNEDGVLEPKYFLKVIDAKSGQSLE